MDAYTIQELKSSCLVPFINNNNNNNNNQQSSKKFRSSNGDAKSVELHEKLFIRLKRLNISEIFPQEKSPRRVKKRPKGIISKSSNQTKHIKYQRNIEILNKALINTTESLKIEESLLKKFRKSQKPHNNTPTVDINIIDKEIFSIIPHHEYNLEKNESQLYPCRICGKVFSQRKGCLIHLKHVHHHSNNLSEEFPCGTCNFKTNNKYYLQSHLFKNHIPDDVKPKFFCNVCGYEAKFRIVLKKHLQKIHLNMD